MSMYDIIAAKRDGRELSAAQIGEWLRGAVAGSVPDYQTAALLMAIRLRGLQRAETHALTQAMLHSGAAIDLSDIDGVKADKHSTGGVGDKTSLMVLPIVASLGLKVAKMSGRGLGHTGGTLDKLGSIPGFNWALDVAAFKKQVTDIGISIIGQTRQLVPADKLLYTLRDVTATVDSIPLIAASIMSKKLATGADVLTLDVKFGSGAIMKRIEDSRELARMMIEIAADSGVKAAAVLTSMEQPLGYAIGNALEVREALRIMEDDPELRGGDLHTVVVALAAELLRLGGVCESDGQARQLAARQLANGAAREKFTQMVRAQGGDDDFRHLPRAALVSVVRAEADGVISAIDAERVGMAALESGAGRHTKEQPIDAAAGLILHCKRGQRVRRGDTLAEIHCSGAERGERAAALLSGAISVGEQAAADAPLIAGIFTTDQL
ncbi:MAG: thymidine phosphorylase [Bacillota bacterium]|nr:thymidine phosphorylase [Bacillota bacterium]